MLSATFKSELNRLPLQDKLEVFDVIRGSVIPPAEDGFPELSVEQMRALVQRAERAASNPGAGRSWLEVKKSFEDQPVSGYRLVVTEEAASDIASARRWYQEQAGLGAAFVSQVEKQLEFIELHPEARPDIVHGIRRSVVKRFPYNVYYSINGVFINILAVWHGKRDQRPIAQHTPGAWIRTK